jgi:16S rRNA (cytosine967-C5)-methyltransferase
MPEVCVRHFIFVSMTSKPYYFNLYLNAAISIVESYKGEVPLNIFLKKYFSENKKLGARDRRKVSSLCYYYFRLGKAALPELSTKDKILAGTFLCENETSEFLEHYYPEWNKKITETLSKKETLLKKQINTNNLFPFADELSEGINTKNFYQSFFVQPDLFLRIRPKVRMGVLKKLESSKLPYQLLVDDCVALPNTTKVEEFFTIDKEVVVQDYNSQKVLNFFKPQNATFKTPLTPAWDCCAASGGKSILLYDIFNQRIDLTISDIRPSILFNLHQRFIKAGIKTYNYFIANLSSKEFNTTLPKEQKQQLKPAIIICDAPCTGSGTWSRTPEQLFFFKQEAIAQYSEKQKSIVSNAVPLLRNDGAFVYITCSVFKKENEEVVDFIREKFKLELVQQELLKGYDKKADSMFVAIFRKTID